MASGASGADLILSLPAFQGTNIVLTATNPTPECPCRLLSSPDLAAGIWNTLIDGAAYQTNFTIPYTNIDQAFFKLIYRPYLVVPVSVSAVEDTVCSISNLQVTGFSTSSGILSLTVANGTVKLGVTNGLTFTAGANNSASFTVSGSYSSLSTGLGNLTYLGSTNYTGGDTLSVALSGVGTNASCVDGAAIPISINGVNDAPVASDVTYYRLGSLTVGPPGLLGSSSDADGDALQIVPLSTNSGHGTLALSADGSITYSSYTGPHIVETFQYRVYDTYGGSLHSTSAPATLTIISDPPPPPPTIAIITPTNSAIFTQGSNIALTVSITNVGNCELLSVDYFTGTNLISSLTASPWSFTWSNAPPGNHALIATVTSGCASVDSTSAVVNITVSADSDGDGISDAQEAINGTDPNDYYNGVAPALQILGGNFQSGAPSATLPVALKSLIITAGGVPLKNAPLTLTVRQGGGLLAPVSSSSWQTNLSLRADASGIVLAQFQLPNSTNNYSFITVAPPIYTNDTITFVEVSTNQVSSGSAYLDVYTPLK